MTDLATLGIRVEGQDVVTADAQLDSFTGSATRAETATERLAAAARGNGAAMSTMNNAMRMQQRSLDAVRGATGLTSHETLNLGRQFADVGVSLASGQAIWMVAIQQGAQIGETFAEAGRRGVGFSAVLGEIMGMAGRMIGRLGPLVLVTGALGGAFALAFRSMSGDSKIAVSDLNLAEEQVKRLKESGEDMSITLGDSFRAFGTTVKEVIGEAFGPQIDAAKSAWSGFLDELTANTAKEIKAILGFFIGGYEAIKATWRMLPAAIGEAAAGAANIALNVIEHLVNNGIEGINRLIAGAKVLSMFNPAFAVARSIGEIAPVSLGQVGGADTGAFDAMVGTAADAFNAGQERASAMVDGFGRRWAQNSRDTALARLREAAGDPNRGSTGKTEAEREIEQINKYIQSLRDQAATMGMSAIAAKEYEINLRAVAAAEHGLEDAVRAAGAQLLEQMRIKAADMTGKAEDLELIRLETRLISAGNVERAVQLAQLRERQRLIGAGVDPESPLGQGAIGAAGDIAREGENLRIGQDRFNDSLRLSLDLAQQLDDQAREMSRGLADAFGEPGRALGDLMTTMTGFQARMEGIAERRAEYERQGTLTVERAAMLERERAQAQIANYGDMAGAARGFFREGSDGYRIMLAIEQAYRLQQMFGALQAMTLGRAETASSVANSAMRGAASMAAGAAKMFEMLGPWAFPAVAAMLGLLAGLGLGGGGGGSGRSKAANDNNAPDESTARVRASGERDAAARDVATSSFAQAIRVEIGVNDERFNAYVDGRTDPKISASENRAVSRSTNAARRGAPGLQSRLHKLGTV